MEFKLGLLNGLRLSIITSSEIYLVEFKLDGGVQLGGVYVGPKSTLWNLNEFLSGNVIQSEISPKSTLWNLNWLWGSISARRLPRSRIYLVIKSTLFRFNLT